MKPLIIVTFFILIFAALRGSIDCAIMSNKNGLTISYVVPCGSHQKGQLFLDSIVNNMLAKLNRQDTIPPIFVMVNDAKLSYDNSNFVNFLSVGYDTLRRIDDEYILSYYWNKVHSTSSLNTHLHFNSRLQPIDINSSLTDTSTQIGIKIIYRRDFKLGGTNWSDIEKLIQYAAKNSEIIKRNQIRDTVRYDWNHWFVSLLSIDTLSINRILNPIKNEKDKSPNQSRNLILGIVGLGLIFIFVLWRRKHSR